ncbi:MAG: hypothetical protein HY261_03175 [Chloroflexi bacterium]|nr:hypothetical protein [Chloroflexota bacterium]
MYKDVPDALHLATTVACSTARARELLVTPRGLNSWLTVEADIASAIGAPVRLRLSARTLRNLASVVNEGRDLRSKPVAP